MKRRDVLKIGGIGFLDLLIPNNVFGLENIVGNIKDVLVSKPVEGASLKFYNYPEGNFISEYSTDSRGDYYSTITGIESDRWADVKLKFSGSIKEEKLLAKPASSYLKAEISHPDYYSAVRYFNLKDRDLDIGLIPKTFDMEFFDAWTRGGKKVLKKWPAPPVWIIDTNNAEQNQIDLVKDIIRIDINPAMSWGSPIINETTTSDNLEKNEGFLIYWVSEGDYYGNHHETLENNKIVSASTWFLKSNKLRRVFLRQMTQGIGFVNNISGNEFYSDDGHYTSQGLDMLRVLDVMAPGNSSPDSNPAPV
ncbi:MAG: hypothetical protein Q7S33_00820 [Nanoarchaeota archaeon]|nr:hypothetical protein [Nanoarchaeota archaeon]